MKNLRKLILKYALQNAVLYRGRASAKAVLGKVLAENPKLRGETAKIRGETERAVDMVNRLGPEQQVKKLEKIDSGLLEKKPKEQEELPPLRGARKGKVVLRFAPSPTGPLNIAQLLRAAMMNYLYARKYKGVFILRIEDTDPARIEKRYYGMIKEDLKNSGIGWDKMVLESDHMTDYYDCARKLIRGGKAYMCSCHPDTFRALKKRGMPCPHRDKPPRQSTKEMNDCVRGKYREGDFVLRLKTSMKDPNPAIRDPPLMRIITAAHPLKGRAFSFWPLYNYANVIEDHMQGITHVFRGKEHEHNTQIQKHLYDVLGWKPPVVVNFGMIHLPGEKVHTRDIKRMIEEGRLSGWDDPRLHTVRALLRRGFAPEAFRAYAIQVGLTKNDITLDWESLETHNRKIMDIRAGRYFAVKDPVEVDISEVVGEGKTIRIRIHPEKRKTRKIQLTGRVMVSRDDFKRFRGKDVRLIEIGNVVLKKRALKSHNQEVNAFQKIQWVPEKPVKVNLVRPRGEETLSGEPAMAKVKKGEFVQLVRIGFGRVDSIRKGLITIYFAHR